ncbi:Na-dependent neurotransmitter transporter (macronuclear) [Tetrahymena thermophila SB210]|uniref:Transporter n=1 Tax=Tetrahymena thermophila (strain SB210) TaxID=312017 RepID=I7MMZ3_TETTS|nr:Na-dependent neurotransmitter transporter [Tetrahymena thermophila SB210]EAS07565.1 Na-dependent neurotransmitter transporter [Tetrahymena thermophila SB210]|eukprot:XP_001027807.1 Na-dependent neurotransmitter transporter [Tetrahymena thermophila SB210]
MHEKLFGQKERPKPKPLTLLTKNEQYKLEHWYDENKDAHENRGEHRAAFNRQLDENHHERDRFNSYYEYLVSVLGFAAGFGSVWRFPYLIFKNGGGVFLIPYFIFLFLIGFPSFYFETAIGQIFQRGPPLIFEKIHKKWKGLGIFPVCVNFSMSTYYNLILAYSIYFLWKSFTYPLPWKLENLEENQKPWNKDYFYKNFLNSSSGLDELGGIVWPIFFCYLLSQVIVYFCIQKGVSVSGKIALFTATSPYILLFILMLRGLFLEGAFTGISYLFSPDWSKLSDLQVWVDAANQIIFQVSTGCGVLIIFGSYRPVSQEIKQTSYMVPMLTVLCGFLASFVIFSFMGYMSHLTGQSIQDIPLSGPDLAFVVFPAVLTLMPFSNLLSIIFFLTMVFLGIDTQFAFMDGLAGSIEDEFHGTDAKIFNITITQKHIRMGICSIVSLSAFLYSTQAGFYYLEFIDSYGVGINLITAVFMEVYFFNWMENWDTLEIKITQYIGEPTPQIYKTLLKYSVPVFTGLLGGLAVILQLLKINKQAWWVSIIGWAFTLYPYYAIYYYYKKYKDEKPIQGKTSQEREEQGNKELEQELVEY